MNFEKNYVELFIRSFISFQDFRTLFLTNWNKDFCNTNAEKLLFIFLKNYYKKNNYFPTRKDLELEFINDKKYDKIRQELLTFIEKVYSINISEYTETFVREVFLNITRKLKIQHTLGAVVEEINKNGKLDVDEVKGKILNSLNIDEGEDEELIDYFNMSILERMKILREMNKSQFKTGMNEDLDDILKLKRKTVVALSAQLGVGKSMFLNNLAAKFVQDGYNVLYLSLEMDSFDITKRIDKILLGFEAEDYFTIPNLVSDRMDDFIKNNEKKLGKLLIKSYPPRSLAAFQLKQLLDKLREKNTIIDVILVDYMTLMRPNFMSKDQNSYNRGRDIAIELQTIAKESNSLIFTVLQVNREAYGKFNQGSETIAESLAIPQQLDYLINMTEWVDETNDQKYFVVGFEKTRDSKRSKRKIYLKLLDNLKIVDTTEKEKELLSENIEKIRYSPSPKKTVKESEVESLDIDI